MTQLVIFGRGVTSKFNTVENYVELVSMKGTTTKKHILNVSVQSIEGRCRSKSQVKKFRMSKFRKSEFRTFIIPNGKVPIVNIPNVLINN